MFFIFSLLSKTEVTLMICQDLIKFFKINRDYLCSECPCKAISHSEMRLSIATALYLFYEYIFLSSGYQ